MGGKVAFVAGYGDVGKGAAEALRGQGARVIVTEVDPICALQAAMDGYEVARVEDYVDRADFFITTTGNKDIIRVEHMAAMKDKAIVANVGHFDNEIDMAGLARSGAKHQPVKPQVDEWIFPDGHAIIVLSEGRLHEPRQRHGPPELRDERRRSPTRCSRRSSCGPTSTRTRSACTACRSCSTRRWRACTSTRLACGSPS